MFASRIGVYLDLIMNLTLLISLSILSDYIDKRVSKITLPGKLLQGLLFGCATLLGMARPFRFSPGIIFDGRSVMISLCALYFGPIPVLVAGVPVVAYRLWLGGAGVIMGVLTVVSSTTIGLIARRRFKPDDHPPGTMWLYAFGLVVHAVMLCWSFTTLDSSGLAIFRRIGLPVMLLYPVATILAGKILSDKIEARRLFSALQRSEERFKLSMEATSDGLWDSDVASGRVYYNPAYYRILGYEPEDFKDNDFDWLQSVHPDDVARARAVDAACIEGRSDYIDHEYRMRTKDGGYRWVHARGKSIARGPDGRSLRLVGTHVDISARKEAEERLHQNLAEKDVLLREIHHRVKNNLNVISSLLNLQASAITTPEQAMSAFQNSRHRINAMSLAHEELYKSRDYSRVDMSEYLGLLFDQLTVDYGTGDRIRLSSDVARIALSVNSAIPCGLIVNELVTNAIRHAYPGGAGGEVRVSLAELDDGGLELCVADDGVGLADGQKGEDGTLIGLTLVRLLVSQLGGRLDILGGGGADFRVRFRDDGQA